MKRILFMLLLVCNLQSIAQQNLSGNSLSIKGRKINQIIPLSVYNNFAPGDFTATDNQLLTGSTVNALINYKMSQVGSLPTQTDNQGKFLYTNGSSLSWQRLVYPNTGVSNGSGRTRSLLTFNYSEQNSSPFYGLGTANSVFEVVPIAARNSNHELNIYFNQLSHYHYQIQNAWWNNPDTSKLVINVFGTNENDQYSLPVTISNYSGKTIPIIVRNSGANSLLTTLWDINGTAITEIRNGETMVIAIQLYFINQSVGEWRLVRIDGGQSNSSNLSDILSTTGSLTLNQRHGTVLVTNSSHAITLPDAAKNKGRKYTLVNYNTGSVLFIATQGGAFKRNGFTDPNIPNNSKFTVQSNGVDWFVIND